LHHDQRGLSFAVDKAASSEEQKANTSRRCEDIIVGLRPDFKLEGS
jgi:hypothetical protein